MITLTDIASVRSGVADLDAATRYATGIVGLELVDQFNPITERVVEADELTDPPGSGLGGRAAVHADA